MSTATQQEWDDEWALSTGLPLDDVDATITKFVFGFNAGAAGTSVCANITFVPDESGEETEQSFSLGDGWEIVGKGEAVTAAGNASGKPRKISGRSNWGRMIGSAIAVASPADLAGISPKSTANWVGTRWHLGTTPIESTNPQTQVTKTKDAMVFTGFLGRVDGAKGAPASGAKASGGTKAAAAGTADTGGIDADLFASLLELAMEHEDHDDFMDVAMERDDVKGDKAVEKVVLSATRKGSVWMAKLAAQ